MFLNALTNRSTIALDIGRREARLLQLGFDGPAPAVLASATLPCPVFARDGALGEPASQGVAATLRALVSESGFRGRACSLSLPSSAFLTDCAEFPITTGSDLSEAVAWDCADRFRLDREAIQTGCLPTTATTSGGTGEYLVIAIRKESAMRAVHLAASAGLQPVRLESAGLASLRAVWRRARSLDGGARFAVLHMEDHRAMLAVLSEAGLHFHRSFAWSAGAEAMSGGSPIDGPIALSDANTGQYLWRWNTLAEEVLHSFRRVERRQPGAWPTAIYVCGPAAIGAGLTESLTNVCGATATSYGLDAGIDWNGVAASGEAVDSWSAAAGLALADYPRKASPKNKEAA